MRSQSKLFRALLGVCAVSAVTFSFERCLAQPSEVSYQGELKKDGLPFTGTAQMKFVVVDGDGESIWSNDGTSITGSEPTDPVSIEIENGIFAVRLGAAPMQPISGGLLKGVTEVALRVWVNTGDGFEQLTDQPISSSAFSLSGEKCLEIGELQINVIPRWNGSALVPGTLFDDGNYVGVGTNAPATKLDVSGTVRSSTGGFQFPDGTIQTTAVTGGGGGVPSGAMIITSSPGPPDGYTYSGLSVRLNGTDSWNTVGQLTEARWASAAVVVNNGVLLIGGNNGAYMSRVEFLDPIGSNWSPRADLPVAQSEHRAAVIEGRVFVAGGLATTGDPMSNFYEYDFSNDVWYTKPNFVVPRYGHAMVAALGKIYLIGGYVGNGQFTSSVEQFDPQTDSWMPATDMPGARSSHSAVALHDKVYVFGGDPQGGNLAHDTYVFDPSLNTWSVGAPLLNLRTLSAGVQVGDQIFAIGGSNGAESRLPTEEYDDGIGIWVIRQALPMKVLYPAVAAVDGRILLLGGSSGSLALSTIFEYKPLQTSYLHQKQ